MADVDMTDAPSASKAKAVPRKAAGPSDSGADGKKRFEVKKVRALQQTQTFGFTSVSLDLTWELRY